MTVFTAALRLIFRRPVYLLIYLFLFGLMGLFVRGTAVTDGGSLDDLIDQGKQASIAVIDRDHSVISQGLTRFLSDKATLVEVEDTSRDLQDATAQNRAAYILIISQGYGESFRQAVLSGGTIPSVETITNYETAAGTLLDLETDSFLNALRVIALAEPDLSDTALVAKAGQTADLTASQTLVQASQTLTPLSPLPFFFTWSAYPLTAGITVLVTLCFASFRAGEVRRRNLASPVSSAAMNVRIVAANLSIVLMAWLFICLLSLVPSVGGADLLATTPGTVGLIMGAALTYALVPLAIGFLLSQFALKEGAANGFVNIIALALMFLSGAFLGGAEFLSKGVRAVANFVPTYWYNQAIAAAVAADASSWAGLSPYVLSLGLILLFALTIFAVALYVGHLRAQTATAGGNPAADFEE